MNQSYSCRIDYQFWFTLGMCAIEISVTRNFRVVSYVFINYSIKKYALNKQQTFTRNYDEFIIQDQNLHHFGTSKLTMWNPIFCPETRVIFEVVCFVIRKMNTNNSKCQTRVQTRDSNPIRSIILWHKGRTS